MSLTQATKGDMPYQVRSLYRSLLRQSGQFAAYNFREYAKRRTRDAFRDAKSETEDRRIQDLMQKGLKELQMLKRQTVISQFYQLDRLVVEGGKQGKQTGDKGDIIRQKDQGSMLIGDSIIPVCARPIFHILADAERAVKPRTNSESVGRRRTSHSGATSRWTRLPSPHRDFPLQPDPRLPPRDPHATIEHNVLEGLPINQYREVEVTVGANTGDNRPVDKDAWPELPMPRDSHLLPEHSQQLLRAARAGRVYKPPVPIEDDNELEDEEKEHKEVKTGFTIKKYVKVARHLEAPEPEYLAKRRKGLPSQYLVNGVAQPALRETKVKKLDADGNATVYKVLVPEGQAVVDEIQPTDDAMEVAPASAAPGTIVEGVGVVNAQGIVVAHDALQQTPIRKKMIPPRKKRGGPGRGRRRVAFAERGTSVPSAAGDLLAVPDVKQEGGSVEPSDGDTPMADAGGEDDEGSGDEGSDDEDHDIEHTSHPATPATPSRPSSAPTSAPKLQGTEIPALDTAIQAPATSAITPEDRMQSIVKEETPVLPTSAPEPSEQSAARNHSSSPDLPLSTVSHSPPNSLSQLPTSATAVEPEPMAIETTEPVAPVPASAAVSTTEAEVSQPTPPVENSSAPPSEPDLMASLDRHLEKDSEDMAAS
ncbi:hypothetical protein ACEQ8H_002530 [Pleosporales sp. CAS-2024a]